MRFKLGQDIIDIIRGKHKIIRGDLRDGMLSLRLTNLCNAKCRYCGIQFWDKDVQKMSLPREVLFEYCKPLYKKIKMLWLTGGDPLIAKNSFEFCEFIAKNYPHITMFIESNGIAFGSRWQKFAMENLVSTHFSLNASNEDIYASGCWDGEAGRNAFRKARENVLSYINLLKENNLEVFAPDISMVINKDTANDIRSFVKWGLENHVKFFMFYFDYTQVDMCAPYFPEPDVFRPALKELMKLERVLAKKIYIYFRLWMPLKEAELLQPEVEAIPIEELKNEYKDILELAKDRDMKKEYLLRQKIRKKHGKKVLNFDEDWRANLFQYKKGNKMVCSSPYRMLDIYPDLKLDCCGWIIPRLNLRDWIENGALDWDKLYNSDEMKQIRCGMINDDYSLCQKCCPLNPEYNEICPPHKYGYDRKD